MNQGRKVLIAHFRPLVFGQDLVEVCLGEVLQLLAVEVVLLLQLLENVLLRPSKRRGFGHHAQLLPRPRVARMPKGAVVPLCGFKRNIKDENQILGGRGGRDGKSVFAPW